MKSAGRMRLIAIGMALVMLGLFMAGCGKKGDPIPQRMKPVAAMKSPTEGAKGIPDGADLRNQ